MKRLGGLVATPARFLWQVAAGTGAVWRGFPALTDPLRKPTFGLTQIFTGTEFHRCRAIIRRKH